MRSKIKFLFLTFVLILVSCQVTPDTPVQIELTETFTPTTVPTTAPIFTNTPAAETVVFEENISPNGEWMGIVSVTTQGINKNIDFIVVNNNSSQRWILENTDFTEPENPLIGFKYPYIFKWSNDGRYIYYSHLSTGGDGCFGLYKPGGFDLIKFDLLEGTSVIIKDHGATWMTLSHDEEKLAFIDTYGGSVSVLNIQNKITTNFPLPNLENTQGFVNDTSDIYWSPDDNSLIYAYYVGVCDFIFPASYIIQLYPEMNYQKILIENSPESYEPIKWDDQNFILLEDSENKTWWLDATTKEITPANE